MFGRRGLYSIGLLSCLACGSTGHSSASAGGGAGVSGQAGSGASSSGGTSPDGGTAGATSTSGGASSGGTASGGVAGAVVGSGGVATGGTGGATTGGTGGTGGLTTGGSGGTGGTVSNLPPSDKLDLLFVIDNSISMAHDQALMSGSIGSLVNRLLNPDCVSLAGVHSPGATPCPSGSQREFAPITDLHVGVVTSSIGGHGADLCSPTSTNFAPEQDDHAHLLPSVRTGLVSFNNLGFLAWNPTSSAPAGSISDPASLTQFVIGEVDAAGETGCGYEAPLEAMYRFLIDPDPPSAVTLSGSTAVVSYPDATTLAQRHDFLRPDSVVAIVLLSDENDCSVVDGGLGWIVGTSLYGSVQWRMPAATSTCATDPNSPCCRSCQVAESTPPTGCVPLNQDSVCQAGTSLSASQDTLNLRCWDQKRRFGLDLLNPVQRYVSGLTSPTVSNRSGQAVPNPLFYDSTAQTTRRDATHVFLLGIVGVPWQDLSTSASLTGTGLEYLTARQLRDTGRWNVVLGDATVTPRVAPLDPLMIESEAPRTGTSPIAGQALAPATSPNPQQNSVNGHEYSASGDLQYACIYRYATPATCTIDNYACDCTPDSDGGITAITAANRPVCQPPGGGAPGSTQYWGKAYPGVRELEVLRGIGDSGVAASLCAKSSTDTTDPNFGFKPAFDALIDRMAPTLVRP